MPATWRTWPVYAAAFVSLAGVSVWMRWPNPELPEALRPVLAAPMLLTVILWFVSGMPGFRDFLHDRLRATWAISLLGLVLWAYASGSWAFMRQTEPGVAPAATIQLGLVVVFAIAIASARLPASWIITALVIGTAFNSILAGQQVALQGPAGGLWALLGEFPISVDQARVSVVQADGIRWLRPYGLLPHPNLLAAFLMTGLAACWAWAADARPRRWIPGGIVLLGGTWALLLTFSRASYLAMAAVGLTMILASRWTHRSRQRLIVIVAVLAAVGLAFAALYAPFLLARAGQGLETTELYSAAERAILTDTAYQVIQQAPLFGVGAGNLPWRAAYMLYDSGSIVQGNYAHQAWLSIWADLGLIGIVLFLTATISGIEAALRAVRHATDAPYRAALLAGFVGWLVISQFEYAPATLLGAQTLWWSLLAVSLSPVDRPNPSRVLD